MTGVLIGGALLMLCGLAAVLLVSRRLSADLSAATDAAEAVAEGRPLRLADLARGRDAAAAAVSCDCRVAAGASRG